MTSPDGSDDAPDVDDEVRGTLGDASRRQPVLRPRVFLTTGVALIAALFVWLSLPKPLEEEQPAFGPPEGGHVMFHPTPHDVVERMLELAQVGQEDMVYDLGCGDGRVLVAAAKKYGCRAKGYDIDPYRVRQSLENARAAGVENLVTVEQADIFTLDLGDADVVFLYLLPELNVRLIPQLERLKPGTRIVSHMFDMQGVTPDERLELRSEDDNLVHPVYLWTTPLKRER